MHRAVVVNTPEVQAMIDQVAALATVRHSDFDDDSEARRKLNAHGLSDAEIARQMATLRSNTAGTAAVLTSYSLLHSLQHLDNIADGAVLMSTSAEATVALFQCAEVCVHNVAVLSDRMRSNIAAGRIEMAVSNARWRAAFHEVLYRLSSLIVEVADSPADGDTLNIESSMAFEAYQRSNVALHEMLKTAWTESDADIFANDLDDPKRYVFFNEFVNASDERVWVSRMRNVRVSGVPADRDETPTEFYDRVVCGSEIGLMMTALETETETDLLSFRAVHQISEIIATVINRQLCGVVPEILDADSGDMHRTLRALVLSNRLLSIVDESIKLLMRSLTPRAYRDIRPNLGMVRGTSSVVLRKTLFNTTYPLMVRALKLRIADFDAAVADDDDVIYSRAVQVLEADDEGSRTDVQVMRQLIVFYQHVRTWRDNHQQLPKTHLGMSAFPQQPTVSLSGSGSAVEIAHSLRRTHVADPIIPLYRAAMGSMPPDVHELLSPDSFEEHMAHATARAVMDVYADVQTRFYQRTTRK